VSKRYPRARWTLPNTVNPSTSTGWCVPVPDDPFHKAAFLGALATLGSGSSWADDIDHTAKDVAQVWRGIVDNLELCPMLSDISIRLKPTDFCTIQLTLDGGATWTDVADLSDCANAAANSIIDGRINDGSLSGGSQPGGIGDGEPGQCYDYDVTLRASDKWISPVKMEGGDTIQITNVKGAWHDGVFGSPWKCADGHTYALGACLGGGQATDEADPAPDIYHMRLVGSYADTPVFFDAYETTFEIPLDADPTDVVLQVNDDIIADDAGSITFHVQICKSFWEAHFYFKDDAGSWQARDSGTATWTSGQGWHGPGTFEACYIKFVIGAATVLKHFSAKFETNAPYVNYEGAYLGYINGGAHDLARNNALGQSPGGVLTFDGVQALAYHNAIACGLNTLVGGYYRRVTEAHLSGSGAFPFV